MLNDNSPYITSVEICERFKVTPRTLLRWQNRETNPMPNPAIKPSGTYFLWLAEDIKNWENSLKENTH